MPVAVEDHTKPALSLRWRQKLFRKGKGVAHDVVEGAEGGKPADGAAPLPQVEERDPIQHVAGTGIIVNDPADPASNRDTLQEAHLEDAKRNREEGNKGGVGSTSLVAGGSARKDEKRRGSDPATSPRIDSDDDDPTAGAGALSDTRRSSVRGDDDDDGEDGGGEGIQLAGDVGQDKITFYHRDQPFFWLSNSSDHPIFLDGIRYPTAEHLFQSLKFLPHRPDLATKVRKAATPLDAMREARKHTANVKKGWIGQAYNVAAMRTVLLLKFSQHSALRRQLLLTGEADLIEDSPTDAFWGAASGSAGGISAGRNELGKALVRTRETIRGQAGLGYGSAAKTV